MAASRKHMTEALAAGRKALPACLPNPPVGAVLVRADQIVAVGFTQSPGADHAEAMAMRAVPGDLSDFDLYVTLEPCSFHGRTPSCAAEIIRRGIRRVHVAILDPDERNAGRGIEMLRSVGVDVVVGLCAEDALRDLGPHLNLPANKSLERSRDR